MGRTAEWIAAFRRPFEGGGGRVMQVSTEDEAMETLRLLWETDIQPEIGAGTDCPFVYTVDDRSVLAALEAAWPQARRVTGDLARRTAVVGVTGCAWAAADTGTVALYAEPHQPLWPSLLPAVHVVWVWADQLVPTLAEGLRRLWQRSRDGSGPPLVKLVSAPSMTADIEGQLIVGVHGPRRVIVVFDQRSATASRG